MISPKKQGRKRFYSEATFSEGAGGFIVQLDKKPIKTLAGKPLLLPAKALAQAIAEEWDEQGAQIVIDSLRMTKLANSAIDGVCGQEEAVVEDIVRYAGSDLVCYRAEIPAVLAAKQAAIWDPILEWAAERFGASFNVTEGIRHIQQPAAPLECLRIALRKLNPFALTAFHAMTGITGSALLAFAHAEGRLDMDSAWHAAHLDEDWQASRWGEDYEARIAKERRHEEMKAASRFYSFAD